MSDHTAAGDTSVFSVHFPDLKTPLGHGEYTTHKSIFIPKITLGVSHQKERKKERIFSKTSVLECTDLIILSVMSKVMSEL